MESSPKRAKKVESKCIPYRIFKEFPPYCEKVLYWVARGTIKELNPRAELRDFAKERNMVHGDGVCDAIIEIK